MLIFLEIAIEFFIVRNYYILYQMKKYNKHNF